MEDSERKQKSHKEAYPVRKKEMIDAIRAEFDMRLRTDEHFLRMSKIEQAKEVGCGVSTIEKWVSQTDMGAVVAGWRAQYDKFKPSIDMALIKKAQRGDTKAIELFYQKMEGWSARQGVDLNVTKQFDGMDNKELMRQALQGMTDSERLDILKIPTVEKAEDTEGGLAAVLP